MALRSRVQSSLRLWLAATAIGLLFSAQSALSHWIQGTPWFRPSVAFLQVAAWWGWALLAPLIFALCRRLPVARPRLALAVAAHVAMAIAMSAAHTVLLAIPTRLALGGAGTAFPPIGVQIVETLGYRIASDLLQYAFIVAGWHAFVYYRELDARAVSEAVLRQELAESELRELRTQLQPHFVSNALNAVAAFVRDDPQLAEEMLVRLNRFFRSVLQASLSHCVPLHREVELIEEYLGIHRLRFGERLRIRVELDGEARQALIPVMLLQPLVENALTHGIGTHSGPGHLRIVLRRDGETIRIAVEDNGDSGAGGASRTRGRGLGLSNTRRRLAGLYGKRYHLSVDHAATGTVVTVTLPFEEARDAS
jgi:two-component system, LytTR family, sensor kinase